MGSPEIAFNVMAVGAFGDHNTTGFADDVPPCTGEVRSAPTEIRSPRTDGLVWSNDSTEIRFEVITFSTGPGVHQERSHH